MFNLETKLEQLIQPVAFCDYQSDLSVWLSAILASSEDAMVIVDSEHLPRGMVTKLAMLSLFAEFLPVNPQELADFRKSNFLNDLLQPLTCVTKTTTVKQFLAKFSNKSGNKNYAVVDSQGKLLGLVNISELLKHCSEFAVVRDRKPNQLFPEVIVNCSAQQGGHFALEKRDQGLLEPQLIKSSTTTSDRDYSLDINEQEINFLFSSLLNRISLPLQI